MVRLGPRRQVVKAIESCPVIVLVRKPNPGLSLCRPTLPVGARSSSRLGRLDLLQIVPLVSTASASLRVCRPMQSYAELIIPAVPVVEYMHTESGASNNECSALQFMQPALAFWESTAHGGRTTSHVIMALTDGEHSSLPRRASMGATGGEGTCDR